MDIYLNGDVVSLSDSTRTITALLLEQDLGERRVAVEVNGEIVPRGRHGEHRLQPGDRVEIVHALGGG
ncbi:sulfur carrier protein ThiS [Luteimonas cucumeris]|nr:sulfur carrier protein ThiS [Luteimonas cucumeris]